MTFLLQGRTKNILKHTRKKCYETVGCSNGDQMALKIHKLDNKKANEYVPKEKMWLKCVSGRGVMPCVERVDTKY